MGNNVAINVGKLTSRIPAAPAPMIEAHNEPGGTGSSGGVQPSLGSAMKKRNNPGPINMAK